MCGSADWEWEADPNAYVPAVVTCKGCEKREYLSKDLPADSMGQTVQLLPAAVYHQIEKDRAAERERQREADDLLRRLQAEYGED